MRSNDRSKAKKNELKYKNFLWFLHVMAHFLTFPTNFFQNFYFLGPENFDQSNLFYDHETPLKKSENPKFFFSYKNFSKPPLEKFLATPLVLTPLEYINLFKDLISYYALRFSKECFRSI